MNALINNTKKILGLLAAIFFLALSVNAQTDREFWYVMPNITPDHNWKATGQENYFVFTTTNLPATVRIEMPANPAWTDVVLNIPANSNYQYTITPFTQLPQMKNYFENTVGSPPLPGKNNRGIHITSTSLITVYHEYANTNNPDIFALKGRNALGRLFYTTFQTRMYNVNADVNNATGWNEPAYSAFDIVFTDNDTYIDLVIPAGKAIYQGPGMTPLTGSVTHLGPFQQGETFTAIPYQTTNPEVNTTKPIWKTTDYYQDGYGRAAADHLNGVKVTSTKDIAITLKDDSMKSRHHGCYDLAGDQTIPTRLLGTTYIAMRGQLDRYDSPPPPQKPWTDSDLYTSTTWYMPPAIYDLLEELYITAIHNNTSVSINGTSMTTINAGQTYQYDISKDSLFLLVEASDSVYVLHMSGFGCEIGEAVLPSISSCTGSAQVGFTRASDLPFFLNIMVRDSAQDNFLLNGAYNALLDQSIFTKIHPKWWAARIGPIDTSIIHTGKQTMISNTEDVFHLGIINGNETGGTRFGYFSDYNVLQVEAFIVASGSRDIRMCYGEKAQIVASGGFFYQWTPTDSLSDPFSPTPLAYPAHDEIYRAEARGACKSKQYTYVNVSVATQCDADFVILDTAIICSPDSIKIMESSLGVRNCEWYWRLPRFPGDRNSYNLTYDSAYRDTVFYHTYVNNSDTVENWQIMLVTLNPYDCRDTAYGYVSILPNTTAEFHVSDSVGCQPLTVTFTNDSYQGNRFRWDFGDNTGAIDSTGNPVSHPYINYSGTTQTYTPRLFASKFYPGYGFCRDSTHFDDIVVYPQPEADIVIDPSEACAPYTATFTPVLETVDTVLWTFDFPNSTIQTSNLIPQTRTYTNTDPNPITPTVILEGWSQYGGRICSDMDTLHLTIYPEVEASFIMDPIDPCDADSTPINFYNNSNGFKLSHMWQFGTSGSDTAFNPAPRLFENKDTSTYTYYITLEETTQDWLYCSDDTTMPLTVRPFIHAEFDISDALLTCHDFTTTFTNLTNRPNANTYVWSSTQTGMTTPAISTFTDPSPFTVQYNNTSIGIVNDYVTLVATNPEGCTDTVTHSLTIYPTVISSITAIDTVGCQPHTVNFTNLSTPTSQIVSYSWDFGDSSSASYNSNIPVSHTFENYTDDLVMYPVTLTVRNNHACEHTDLINVYVGPWLEAEFSFNDTNKCHPRNLYLQGSSKGAIALNGYSWDFDDGDSVTNSFNSSINHTFINPKPSSQNDTFNVKLRISNFFPITGIPGGGLTCTDVFTKPVVVYPEVFANFDPSHYFGCNPLTVTNFGNVSLGAKHYYWSFGDNTFDSISSPPPHIFENETINDYPFPVHLRALSQNTVCEDDTTIDITVAGLMIPYIKIDDPTVCHMEPLHIYNQSIGNITSTWHFGSSIEDYQDPDFYHSLPNTGTAPRTVTVRLVVANNDHPTCTEETTHNVIIYPQVIASFDSILPGCHPLDRNIVNTSKPLNRPNLYEWDFGDLGTSVDSAPFHRFNNFEYTDVQYLVTLKATSPYNCVDSTEQWVDVYHVPLAKMFVPNNIACTPNLVQYTNKSKSTNTTTYYWDFDWNGVVDTITTDVNVPLSYPFENPGSGLSSYTSHLLAVSNHGCTDFDTLTIQVFPGVGAIFGPDTFGCSPVLYQPMNSSFNADNYDWEFINGNTVYRSTVAEPTQILTNKTNQDVQFMVILNASSESGCAGVDTHYVTVFPQPRTGFSVSSSFNTWYPGITIQFYNESEHILRFGDNHPVDYVWNFGDIAGDEQNNNATVPHTYSSFSHDEERRSYVITLTGTNSQHPQCTHTTVDTIFMEPPVPELNVVAVDDIIEICQYESITFRLDDTSYVDLSVPDPVTWNFDDGTPIVSNSLFSMTHRYDTARIYRVQVTLKGNGNLNTGFDDIIVVVHPKPYANFDVAPRTVSLPDYGLIRLYNYSRDATQYQWYVYGTDYSTVLTGFEPTYDYNVDDELHLPGVGDTVKITLVAYNVYFYGDNRELVCSDDTTDVLGVAIVGKGLLYYPLAFEPGGPESANQEFKPYMGEESGGVVDYEIWIYNRWGELVFHTTNPDEGWDGTLHGKLCRMDTYVYKVKANFSSGKSYFHVGDVTLIR
ncbi:MAG: PKD domain-containing protein [Bacteroidales bacterium]|nr:PKD domain-containing protein [Bacteroidales bacterium]